MKRVLSALLKGTLFFIFTLGLHALAAYLYFINIKIGYVLLCIAIADVILILICLNTFSIQLNPKRGRMLLRVICLILISASVAGMYVLATHLYLSGWGAGTVILCIAAASLIPALLFFLTLFKPYEIKSFLMDFGRGRIPVRILCLVLVLGSIILPSGYEVYKGIDRSIAAAPFQDYLTEYSSLAVIESDAKPSAGRAVVIDMKTGTIDKGVHFGLPDNLRAHSPEEVVTVIQLERELAQVGIYTDGAAAYKHKCTITVIDLVTQKKIASTEYFGGEAPDAKSAGGSRSGSDVPNKWIINYITEVLQDNWAES